MKSSEKAKELVEKFQIQGNNGLILGFDIGKQCALICVEEILEATRYKTNDDHRWINDKSKTKYWQEVKQHLNNL